MATAVQMVRGRHAARSEFAAASTADKTVGRLRTYLRTCWYKDTLFVVFGFLTRSGENYYALFLVALFYSSQTTRNLMLQALQMAISFGKQTPVLVLLDGGEAATDLTPPVLQIMHATRAKLRLPPCQLVL
mmetsp:Transcript_17906/g.34944  ORF Transcript_17906/g.34944 Transcript_17906/m.34944 type:complete len:131 (+) Transcript_17906:881-1273(+)